MEVFANLLKDDVGLLSIFTIGFVCVMGAFFANYISKKVKSSDENKEQK